MATYSISTRHEDMQLERVHALLASSYWSPRIRRDVVSTAMANSLVVGAFLHRDDGTQAQVGFARVVTDYATFAWLCDVIVDEAHRGRGLSKCMLDSLFAVPSLGSLRRWCLATRDAHGLYRQYGFADVVPGAWLERKSEPSVWQEQPVSAK